MPSKKGNNLPVRKEKRKEKRKRQKGKKTPPLPFFSVQAKAKSKPATTPRYAKRLHHVPYRSRSLLCIAPHRIWKCMYTAVSIELFLVLFIVIANAIMQPKPSPRLRTLAMPTRVARATIQTTSMHIPTSHQRRPESLHRHRERHVQLVTIAQPSPWHRIATVVSISLEQVPQSPRRTLLACCAPGTTLFFFLKDIAESCGVVVRGAQSVPVAVAFAFVVWSWCLAW
jgi:hypothetical protein